MPEVTIEPNEKYSVVIGEPEGQAGGMYHRSTWEEHEDAAESYQETVDNSPTTEELDIDESELNPLSWDDFSVSKDPDLVSKMATYFDGMEPDEPTDLLRAKLRLLDCEVYANAQIAAQAELRD